MENLYTFIGDYNGDTMIRQVKAQNEVDAVTEFSNALGAEYGNEWKLRIQEEEPALIEKMTGVWCIAPLIEDKLLLCHFTSSVVHC